VSKSKKIFDLNTPSSPQDRITYIERREFRTVIKRGGGLADSQGEFPCVGQGKVQGFQPLSNQALSH
jgi:hypothetical protein